MAKEKPTTKICKHCKTEIPYEAKVCPQCRKKQKGGILKWIVIAIIALIVIGALGSGGDKNSGTKKVGTVETEVTNDSSASTAVNDDADQSTAEQDTMEKEEPIEVKDAYHVGDILQDGDTKIVYIASGEYKEENEFLKPKDGNKYVFLEFAFENTGSSDVAVSSFSFNAYADGYDADMYYGNDNTLDATLSSGRTTSGKIIFEVPLDVGEIEVEYEPNIFSEKKIKFVYDGEKSSGYEVETKTQATASAYHVGDIVEAGDLKISYISCNTNYKSNNQFIVPKDGNKFIQCEMEFENIGSSDQMVSSFLFDCYADGQACDASYTDNDISATLSAGRKAKGTVTYEVPEQATVIELEYNSNVWTSERIVFTVE